VGLEHTIPGSERAKTVHALDRSATVTGTGTTLHLPYQEKSTGMFPCKNMSGKRLQIFKCLHLV
jgi:hypothetical protein